MSVEPVPSPDKWGGLSSGLTTHPRKNGTVTETNIEPRNRTNLMGNDSDRIHGRLNWKTPLKIGSWNVRSLFRPGYAKSVTEEMSKYNLDIMTMQEVRWPGSGECKIDKHSIIYSGRKDDYHWEGVGVCLNEKARKALISVQAVNERLIKLRLCCTWLKRTLIVGYAPINDSQDDSKDKFYDQLQELTVNTPKHDILIIAGDMNAKVGRETDAFAPAIGKESVHVQSNDNGIRLASYANINNLIIGGTLFPHRDIHKISWISADGDTHNQIDHILINRKFRSALQDVRSYRGADCDTDHHLVIAKVKVRLKMNKNQRSFKRPMYDLEKLNVERTCSEYQVNLQNRFSTLGVMEEEEKETSIDEDWKEWNR